MNRLENCELQHIPDLPPHISVDSVSNDELKKKLVTAIQRDYRWRTPGKITCPRVVTMEFGHPSDRDALVEPKLLPGAKELLSIRDGRLELWSVERQEHMWTAPASRGNHVALAFEFELLAGRELMIAVIDAEEGFSQTCMLQVFSVNMDERTHERRLTCDMPWAFFFRMMFIGDVLLVPMPAFGMESLVINWRTGGWVILDYSSSTVCAIFYMPPLLTHLSRTPE